MPKTDAQRADEQRIEPARLLRIMRMAAAGGLRRAEAETELRKIDPVLADLCLIEAYGDQRLFANDDPYSRLTAIRDRARCAIEQITGCGNNPLFPINGATSRDPWGLRATVINFLKTGHCKRTA